MACTVLIKKLASDDKAAVRALFQERCGEACPVKVTLTYSKSKKKKVFQKKGRVTLPDEAALKKALSLDGTEFAGKPICVVRLDHEKTSSALRCLPKSRKARKRVLELQRTVVFLALPPEVTERHIKRIASQSGVVENLRYTSGNEKGAMCFVTMKTPKGKARLLTMGASTQIRGHSLRVMPYREMDEIGDDDFKDTNPAECFLWNLPVTGSEESLRRALREFGHVINLRFVDKEGAKRSAVVEFERASSAAAAVASQKIYVEGRPVPIDFSKKRLDRTIQRNIPHELKEVTRVLVAGLPEWVTKAEIERLFVRRCGDVDLVLPLSTRDKIGTRQAMVQFRLPAGALAAIEMTGLKWRGSALFVQPIHDENKPCTPFLEKAKTKAKKPPAADKTAETPKKHRDGADRKVAARK
eukprot:TRINITY_DN969_c0_g1_i1.p1 TRINITY_DN969_c0_g1~~TRINITY_DN969_c0_g1_i1.p1  ORF type:complete len:423 (-),score=119.70 TRINITY_DN969_c0_g1_i1:56-1294(-)